MPRTVDEALAELFTPKPSYDAIAAQNRFLFEHSRAWGDAVDRASEKPGAEPAAQLSKLLLDTPAVQLRHFLAETHEDLEASDDGLQHALAAAACSPQWDPTFVAWSLRGIAFWLRRLGRVDEARSVLDRLWALNPLYAVGRAEAAALGVEPPPLACPTGPADHLRLAGFQVLLGGFRPTHMRHIAMAVSLMWTQDFAAAARMARLAGKGTPYEGTWAADLEAFAAKEATRSPGAATPLPDAPWNERATAVKDAIKREDLPLLRALALDPSEQVMLPAWVGLAKLGEGDVVRALLVEMIAASTVGSTKTELCFELEYALARMPAKTQATPSGAATRKTTKGRASAASEKQPSSAAVALAKLALAEAKNGAACVLPLEKTRLAHRPVPPSLAAWIAGGGGLHVTKPATLGTLAKEAHGDLFAKLPESLASSRALALDLPEVCADTFEALALDFADEHGEAPVLALDVSDGPAIWVVASSFGEWIAEDVEGSTNSRDAEAIEAATRRVFGGRPPVL